MRELGILLLGHDERSSSTLAEQPLFWSHPGCDSPQGRRLSRLRPARLPDAAWLFRPPGAISPEGFRL